MTQWDDNELGHGSQSGMIFCQNVLAMSLDSCWVVEDGRMQWASSGLRRPGVLLNILRYTVLPCPQNYSALSISLV